MEKGFQPKSNKFHLQKEDLENGLRSQLDKEMINNSLNLQKLVKNVKQNNYIQDEELEDILIKTYINQKPIQNLNQEKVKFQEERQI